MKSVNCLEMYARDMKMSARLRSRERLISTILFAAVVP